MAVNYYIADKPIKAEYEAFRKFWEDELFPEFIKKLYGYCQETGGRIVNKDLAEEIAEDHLCGYSCVPLSETTSKTPLVTVNHAGIFWRKCLIEDRPVNQSGGSDRFLFQERAPGAVSGGGREGQSVYAQ